MTAKTFLRKDTEEGNSASLKSLSRKTPSGNESKNEKGREAQGNFCLVCESPTRENMEKETLTLLLIVQMTNLI